MLNPLLNICNEDSELICRYVEHKLTTARLVEHCLIHYQGIHAPVKLPEWVATQTEPYFEAACIDLILNAPARKPALALSYKAQSRPQIISCRQLCLVLGEMRPANLRLLEPTQKLIVCASHLSPTADAVLFNSIVNPGASLSALYDPRWEH